MGQYMTTIKWREARQTCHHVEDHLTFISVPPPCFLNPSNFVFLGVAGLMPLSPPIEERWRETRDHRLNKFEILIHNLWDVAAKRPDVKTEHFVAFGQDCQDTDGPHGFDLSLASSTTWWLAPDIASNTGQNILYLPGVFSWR